MHGLLHTGEGEGVRKGEEVKEGEEGRWRCCVWPTAHRLRGVGGWRRGLSGWGQEEKWGKGREGENRRGEAWGEEGGGGNHEGSGMGKADESGWGFGLSEVDSAVLCCKLKGQNGRGVHRTH